MWNKLVKEEAATQPTIRGDLEEMLKEVPPLVKTVDTDQKARGGRPSDYYDLDFLGLSTLVVYFETLGERANDPRQFARHVAEKYHDLLPSVFNLWPEFIKENAEDLAWRGLKRACGDFAELTPASFDPGSPRFSAFGEKDPVGSPDYATTCFFGGIMVDLGDLGSINPFYFAAHDAWLQVVARDQMIREALVGFALNGLAEKINDVSELLRLLPDHSCSTDTPSFNDAFRSFFDSMVRVDREMEAHKGSAIPS